MGKKPPLTSLHIEGYRGFERRQSLHFAAPTGKLGSGLTILVGPNSGGKSSVVEALDFFAAPGQSVNLGENERNARARGRVRIDAQFGSNTVSFAISPATGAATWDNAHYLEAGRILA